MKNNITEKQFGNTLHCSSSGFTLAEVLITLVVIGVVAAFTIPTMIVKHQKEETAIRLKKTYNHLTQAVSYAMSEHGDTSTWDYERSASDFFDEYLRRYILLSQKASSQVQSELQYRKMNGDLDPAGSTLTAPQSVTYMLADGELLTLSSTERPTYKTLYVDINGYKGPNRYGRDVFQLTIQPVYGITPQGFGAAFSAPNKPSQSFGYIYDRNKIMSGDEGCHKNGRGAYCAALIFHDNWQIKDDYPW